MTSPDTEFISILGAPSGSDTVITRSGGKSLPEVLPILGLSDIVIFPGMVAPLLVESAASIRLIDDVVAGDRFIGLVLQKKPDVENPAPEDLWNYGCAVRVMKMLKFPDNTVRVLVEGLRRFHIGQYESHEPYLPAKVEVIRDQVEQSLELTAMTRNAQLQFQEIIQLSPAMSHEVKVAALNTEHPGKLADLIAANLNLSLEERQQLLEMNMVKERLARLLPLLSRELEVLTLGSKIQKEVASSMSKSQRDFFLREQIRAIQRELGESDPAASEINSLREQIEKNRLPEESKKLALKELERLQQIPPTTPEYTVSRNYLDWIVNLPDQSDKVGSDFRGDPAAALLEVLDPQQNNTFTDNYLDLPFDLSPVLFITTANWLDPIHPALRDRLEVIELPSYTATEKLQIAKRFLVPRQLEEHGLKAKLVKLTDATLKRLIQDYTREAGVRQLEREIAALTRKAARKIVSRHGLLRPLTVGPHELADYLGPAKFETEMAETITESGVAIGLAWTPVGGDILFIEATRMPGTSKLLLTGSLGEVMKESAQTALTYLRSQGTALKLDFTEFDKQDIHIHVPAGATPKDGPSAGVTIVAALASLLLQKRVRSDVAMTGEISLRGRVLPVGGIKEKVLAANRAGIRYVILPEQNSKDWVDVPAEVRHKVKACFVRRISEILPLALRAR